MADNSSDDSEPLSITRRKLLIGGGLGGAGLLALAMTNIDRPGTSPSTSQDNGTVTDTVPDGSDDHLPYQV